MAPNLLALAGGQLLAWGEVGDASIRDARGKWGPEVRLPVRTAWDVVPDGAGFLMACSTNSNEDAVILFDQRATELRRWRLPETSSRLLVEDNRRWAVFNRGTIELFADGRTGDFEGFSESDEAHRPSIAPLVFHRRGSRWVCWGADLTEAHSAAARCQRIGGERWLLPGAGQEPPVQCGDWLIARVGRDQRALGVWSLDGRAAGRHRYPSVPVVTCAGDAAAVVGSRNVQIVELPSWRSTWTRGVRGGAVSAVAAVGDQVVYAVEDSTEVVALRR